MGNALLRDENHGENSILLIIEAAIDFLDVPFFRQTIFNPLTPNTTFFGGRNILPGETDGREHAPRRALLS